MASNEHTIAPIPQADAEGTNKEHIQHHDAFNPDHTHVSNNEDGEADLKNADVTPNVKGGDLASKWLANYDGPKPELTDKLSNKIRTRVSRMTAGCWAISLTSIADRLLPNARLLLHLLLSTTRQVQCFICGQLWSTRRRQLER